MQRRPNPIVRGNIAAGTLDRLPGDAVAWPEGLIRSLIRTLCVECGPAAETILRRAGRTWGRLLGQRIQCDLAHYHEAPLNEIPAARVAASLESVFAKHGWGRIHVRFDRHATGLIEIAANNGISTIIAESGSPVADHLMAGTLAGLFSELAGMDLDCLQTDYEVPGSAPAQFVIALPERLALAAEMARTGHPHHRVIEFLESTQAE